MANLFVRRDSEACKARYGESLAAAKKAHAGRQREINARHKQAVKDVQDAYDATARSIPDDTTALKRYTTALMEADAMRDAAIRKSAELHDSEVIKAWRELHDSPAWIRGS